LTNYGNRTLTVIEFALWTRDMVRELIRREFGVGLWTVSATIYFADEGRDPQRTKTLPLQPKIIGDGHTPLAPDRPEAHDL
jgi:hypothetical protein